MGAILVVNAGSSSLKFQAFRLRAVAELKNLIKGQFDRISTRGRGCAPKRPTRGPLIDQAYALDQVAVHVAGAFETQKVELVAVGHRGLHGIELCR
jgi:acetate kinase